MQPQTAQTVPNHAQHARLRSIHITYYHAHHLALADALLGAVEQGAYGNAQISLPIALVEELLLQPSQPALVHSQRLAQVADVRNLESDLLFSVRLLAFDYGGIQLRWQGRHAAEEHPGISLALGATQELSSAGLVGLFRLRSSTSPHNPAAAAAHSSTMRLSVTQAGR